MRVAKNAILDDCAGEGFLFDGRAEKGDDGDSCGEGHGEEDGQPGEGGAGAEDAVVAGEELGVLRLQDEAPDEGGDEHEGHAGGGDDGEEVAGAEESFVCGVTGDEEGDGGGAGNGGEQEGGEEGDG